MHEKKRIARAVSGALDVDVDLVGASDGTWRLAIPGMPRQPRLRTMWLGAGWPADVNEALRRHPDVTLMVAPVFSSGSREILDAHGINWVDEIGSARVRALGLLVRLDADLPPPDPTDREWRWSPLAVLAGEAVLALRPDELSTAWVAEHAHCSVPRAAGILKAWDAEGWTAKRGPARGRGAHRTVDDAGGLLGSWAGHMTKPPLERWYAHSTTRDLHELQQRIGHAMGDLVFAWTGWAAAEQLAPFVTQLPVLQLRVSEDYPQRELEPALRAAGLTITEDAGRVELWRTPAAAFTLATSSSEGPMVSWPRVYADLKRLGGRGEDAAEHLRDVMQSERD